MGECGYACGCILLSAFPSTFMCFCPCHGAFITLCANWPPTHLLLGDPDLVCNLVNEPEVVTHKHHAALKAVDGTSKRVNGLHVQVVGRLVKDEHVWCCVREPRKDQARSLTVAQVLDGHHLGCTRGKIKAVGRK